MCHQAEFWLGELGSGKAVTAREHVAAAVGESCSLRSTESCSLRSAVLFCVFCILPIVVVTVCLLLLFAVLLNCPYPDPPVFCLFLSILLRTPAGGGAAAWPFCCQLQPNYNIKSGAQAWGMDNGRAEQRVLKQLS